MNLHLDKNICSNYSSPSQQIRIMSEDWTKKNIFCPNCGGGIERYENNNPAGDFYCRVCKEEFELKSKKGKLGYSIVDGAYSIISSKIRNGLIPNFFFLVYSYDLIVTNFFVVPKHFITLDVVEKRKPLSSTARRAGWIGCNILLGQIPSSGRIYYIRNCETGKNIMDKWRSTLFLRDRRYDLRGWTLDIMNCIDKIDKEEFELEDIYKYEDSLRLKYPNNRHIRDKIRQQLQFLRDKGYLIFTSRGKYKKRFSN
jgi:type II restriction enzyme